jgi:hypothetical protein
LVVEVTSGPTVTASWATSGSCRPRPSRVRPRAAWVVEVDGGCGRCRWAGSVAWVWRCAAADFLTSNELRIEPNFEVQRHWAIVNATVSSMCQRHRRSVPAKPPGCACLVTKL